MAKVQHISGITKRLPFEDLDFYDLFRITFENSELGRMKRLLPLPEMAVNFGLASTRGSADLVGWYVHANQE
ncbi:MAG: hypothetical protein IKH63_00270 [Prevotella sp.]|nr:hypothetical protein [Prevotella sp.]